MPRTIDFPVAHYCAKQSKVVVARGPACKKQLGWTMKMPSNKFGAMTPALKWMLPSKTRAMHQLSVKSSCDRGTWSKIRNCAHCLLLTVLRPCLWLHLQQCNCWTQEKHMPSVHVCALIHVYIQSAFVCSSAAPHWWPQVTSFFIWWSRSCLMLQPLNEFQLVPVHCNGFK